MIYQLLDQLKTFFLSAQYRYRMHGYWEWGKETGTLVFRTKVGKRPLFYKCCSVGLAATQSTNYLLGEAVTERENRGGLAIIGTEKSPSGPIALGTISPPHFRATVALSELRLTLCRVVPCKVGRSCPMPPPLFSAQSEQA